MAPRKRPSLADIAAEENEAVKTHAMQKKKLTPKKNVVSEQMIAATPAAEKNYQKSEFIKMSITVDPGSFDKLLDISRERRKTKQPHTMSELVRTALKHWLENIEA